LHRLSRTPNTLHTSAIPAADRANAVRPRSQRFAVVILERFAAPRKGANVGGHVESCARVMSECRLRRLGFSCRSQAKIPMTPAIGGGCMRSGLRVRRGSTRSGEHPGGTPAASGIPCIRALRRSLRAPVAHSCFRCPQRTSPTSESDTRLGRRLSHKGVQKALEPNWWETYCDLSL
jgi:hypothetical protein